MRTSENSSFPYTGAYRSVKTWILICFNQYMIQNMIRPVIQIYHSTLELTVVFTYLLFIFSCRCYNLIKEHVYYFFSNLLFYWFRVYKYSNVFSLNLFSTLSISFRPNLSSFWISFLFCIFWEFMSFIFL